MPSPRGSSRHAHQVSSSLHSRPVDRGQTPTPTQESRRHHPAPSKPSQPSGTQGYHLRKPSTADLSSLASGNRDSFASILDDPFFNNYKSIVYPETAAESSGQPAAAKPAAGCDERANQPLWPPPARRESLSAGPSRYQQIDPPPSAMETFNIAVIGSEGVGKSSFVQRVLNLPRPPITNASTVRMPIDNVMHMVMLLELDLEHFALDPELPIQWPKQINGHIMPRVDAALILYDVMNRASVAELPQTMAALTNSGLPAILVATKCENPKEEWEVIPDIITGSKFYQSCLASYKLSSENPEIARTCLQAILKAAIIHRREENGETVSRRRAQSNLEMPDTSSTRSTGEQNKHSRASSDLSLLRGFANLPINERGQASKSPRLGKPGESDIQTQQSYNSMLRTSSGIRLDRPGTESSQDIDESDAESRRYSDDVPILQRNDETGGGTAKIVGASFDELVDRLLAPRISKNDSNFSDIFLCLYRKFAAPGELFSAILTRLDDVRDDKTSHYLTKTATQLRMIEVVARWVSLYPGDFARPTTRRNLEEFIKHLSTEPIFSISAQQIRRNLHFNVTEDDDTGWANTDEDGDKAASDLLKRGSDKLGQSLGGLGIEDEEGDDMPSRSSDNSFGDRGSVGSQFQFHWYDEYEREASTLEPSSHLPMNKFRYHIFMDIPDEEIADELTRIDWVMFSSIRVRDFVRHVSLSTAEKGKCRSLQNVNRMIAHFNHVAQWVANLILLRDKAKHRAQMMEKFMNIALKLRQMNNYNGLAAVLAGINGTSIHRLAQTRALVPPEVQKRFARLVILMGTQKSHFAYRLAWENSPLPRIPFIPLHRRDLVSAEEGSKTFVGPKGDRINWKKFEVLGEVLLPIMKSQGTPYPGLSKHDNIKDMILGCRMPTDDELWKQLGIRLISLGDETALPANEIGLSIQHPDLTSALVASTKTLVAEFVSARCAIDLSVTQASSTVHKRPRPPVQKPPDEATSNNRRGIHQDVDIDDQRAVYEFVANLHECEERDRQPNRSKRRRVSETQHPIEKIGLHKNAIDTAIRVILFGSNSTGNSYRPLEQVSAPGLSQLAPGVFNVPYTEVIHPPQQSALEANQILKIVSKRENLCTTISSSLARMAGAESPSLRRKIDKLKISATAIAIDVPPKLDIIQGIERSVLEIILKSSKSPSRGKRKANGQSDRYDLVEQQSNLVDNASASPIGRSSPLVMEICDDIPTTTSDERVVSDTLDTSVSNRASSSDLTLEVSHIHEYFSSLSQTLWYEPALPSDSQPLQIFRNE
ncbi:unnamed protein product [Clonostachys solani]|uniref:Ras guanine nucleotide exchange factor A n=1 Tax=Clonostachys solani TaxID=160281 RepID=A0A9N9ZQI2_9HYPO|nr:unnamed protein product [Clonostachys solani]